MIAPVPARTRSPASCLLAAAVATSAWGCATAGTVPANDVATEAEWRVLAVERPAPLPGAPRVTVSGVLLTGAYEWSAPGTVGADLGIAELAVTGLLRRRDVDFVERRRFSVVAEAERANRPRRPGQPPAGVSRSVDFSVTAVWIATAAGASLEVRLTRLETGDIEGATRVEVPGDADPVTVARAVVTGVLGVLDELGVRPAWNDPMAANVNVDRPVRVSDEAQRAFFRALASEERWNWEGARRGYQAALAEPGFWEASVALGRAARLRLGGTLAES